MSKSYSYFDSFASFTGLFDAFTNGDAGYSLRRLRTAYAGNCIRVRRSSDNAEQDIGFLLNVLDESALTTFVGANNGFVVRWYDQSGNGYDVVNTTTANQPNIVTSGTVNTKNGKPCINFDGASIIKDLTYAFAIPELNSGNSFSFFNVINNRLTENSGTIFGIANITSQNWRMFMDSRTTLNRNVAFSTTGGVFRINLTSPYISTDQIITTGIINGSSNNVYGYNNGNNGGSLSFTGSYSNVDFHMGYSHASLGAVDGNIQEIIMFGEDKNSEQSAIEGNINTYYGVF